MIPFDSSVMDKEEKEMQAVERQSLYMSLGKTVGAVLLLFLFLFMLNRTLRPKKLALPEAVIAEVAPEIDVIISTGGTGLTGRDVTPEAFRSVFDKEIDGFSAVFHRISYDKIGTSTIQSRACAGVAKGTYLFALPGSPGAVKDGWDGILKGQLDYRHKPCNFIEIMPRLEEHLRRK
jgi:molybdenum cofactor synthesis domain-containing protein